MPSWKIHLKVANNLKDRLNMYDKKDEFYIGNVLPDIYTGHVIKNTTKIIDYDVSHYKQKAIINGGTFYLPDYESFKNIHMENLANPVILGYLIHLMTDYFFNKYTFTNCTVLDSTGNVCGIKTKKDEILKCNKNTMTRMKQEDFNAYNDMINIEKLNVSYTSELFESFKFLETFSVEQEDLLKVINYLNSITISENTKKQKPLILFTKEKLDNLVEECTEFILAYLNKI